MSAALSASPAETEGGCAFCALGADRVVEREGPCIVIWTEEPPEGSLIVLPREHRRAPWDLTAEEWTATQTLLRSMMERVSRVHQPQGWNVGWNVGKTAGQSVLHAHCHLVPRYEDEPYAGRGLRWWFKQAENARGLAARRPTAPTSRGEA